MDKPFLEFLSALADATIIIPIIDACLGVDIITGEDLSDFERGMKGVFAAVDVVTLMVGIKASGIAKVITKDSLVFAGKAITINIASNGVAYAVGEAGEIMDLPLPLTLLISVSAGTITATAAGEYVFATGVGEELLRADKKVVDDLVEHLDEVDGVGYKDITSLEVKTVIEKNGLSVEEFSKLLDPNRMLTPQELQFVDKVRADIGLPEVGTVMNKTIPQSDIYNYLYNENYSGVRGFVSVDEHSSSLSTLDDVFEGNRLDYNNTEFKVGNGVDGVSQSVGNADTVYGKITYVLEDADEVKVPTDFPTAENAPYTGRGFTGSKNIVLPELVQENRKFITGDTLSIHDSVTGNTISQFIYDKKLGIWILKE
ncbi:pre-toxin TG domain-containing protein [Anaerosporobacter sp.]